MLCPASKEGRPCPMNSITCVQVYLAKWQEVPVAVKLLVGPAMSLASVAAAAEQLLSPTNPLVAALEQVSSTQGIWRSQPPL